MKTFIKKIVFTLLATVMAPVVVAQNGTSAYSWLDITSSSKIYGLGGMNISLVDDDLSTTDQNPALLGSEMSGQMVVNYMRYIGGSNIAGVRYAHSAGERAAWSVNVQYFGYGSIKETLADGTIIGDFSPKDMSFGGSYSHDITDNLRGGFDIKMLYSSYADFSAFALCTDLGLNYYNSDKDISFSLVVANLGGQIKRFDQAYDRLPIDVRLGWSQTFGTFPIRFSITAWNLTKWHLPFVDQGDGTSASEPTLKDSFTSNLFRHLVFGADLISSKNFYIGLGYSYKTRSDMSTYQRNMLSGWSMTAGIRGRNFGMSMALAQPHTGATTFMLNLNMALSSLIK